jgi:ABC-type phosphate/phosphonate transport system substrate-binding protein
MKTTIALAVAFVIGVALVGCEHKTTTEKKSEVTVTTPSGQSTTSIDQKTETTPDSTTKTTVEKTETKP